ncbi:MAG: DUF3578 domain-containing protein [Geminicoccaceae bacterium]|nr:DUF3578 domain-containing protein [Geminicoccaceae bacterium]
MLGGALRRIATGYRDARREPFHGHPMLGFVRRTAPAAVASALQDRRGRVVRGGAGWQGWAAVPWVAVFETAVTRSAKRGHYVVYLFHGFEPRFYLALVHGTVAVRDRFGDGTRDELRRRAGLIRAALPDAARRFPLPEASLGGIGALPLDYEAAVAFGRAYDARGLPDEAALQADLNALADAARDLARMGGVPALSGPGET